LFSHYLRRDWEEKKKRGEGHLVALPVGGRGKKKGRYGRKGKGKKRGAGGSVHVD